MHRGYLISSILTYKLLQSSPMEREFKEKCICIKLNYNTNFKRRIKIFKSKKKKKNYMKEVTQKNII